MSQWQRRHKEAEAEMARKKSGADQRGFRSSEDSAGFSLLRKITRFFGSIRRSLSRGKKL